MDSTPPKTPNFIVHISINDCYTGFEKKYWVLLLWNYLLGIFRQLLGSEPINIKSWKFNWGCTITIQEKSRSFRLIYLFWVGQIRGFPTGGPQSPSPSGLIRVNICPSWLNLPSGALRVISWYRYNTYFEFSTWSSASTKTTSESTTGNSSKFSNVLCVFFY